MYCRSRPQYRSDLSWILGVAFLGTLTRSARPVRGFTFVRCCSTPSSFFPTRPRGAKPDCLATLPPACSCLRLAVATNSLRRGLAPPIQGPCLAHQERRVGAEDCSSAPLTEPDMRASHPACMGLSLSRVSRHFCLPLSFHSFVRPAPRAFFRPDRIFPSPSRAAAVKDGASSAPPKARP